jgi:hypothetical protein
LQQPLHPLPTLVLAQAHGAAACRGVDCSSSRRAALGKQLLYQGGAVVDTSCSHT